MSDCSNNINPLVRNGTNRKERNIEALNASYALPDEYKLEDWMVFAHDLAEHIKYFNSENKNADNQNWQPFFNADVSAQLALIAVQDVNDYRERIRACFKYIQDEKPQDMEHDAWLINLKQNFGWLFCGIFSLAYRIDYFGKILPDTVPLKKIIGDIIAVKLAPALFRITGYYYFAVKNNPTLIDETINVKDTVSEHWTILAFELEQASVILKKKFEGHWKKRHENKTDDTVFKPLVSDVWKELNHVVNHNLFSGVFTEFLSGYARIVNLANLHLQKTVTEQNIHQPHYALYLTFLHLFKHAQAGLNTYTARHLDFYYKDILKLLPKDSEPNHVHLTLELAASVNEHLLKKGTAFKAGKDSSGNEVVYTSDEDIIVNKAAVSELRSFFHAAESDTAKNNSPACKLFASSVANSADGNGAKLTTEEKDWHPFANKIFSDGVLEKIIMPEAQIGFAIASHYLFLKEGQRSITITLEGKNLHGLNKMHFDIYLTTEKGWLKKINREAKSETSTSAKLKVELNAGDPPVTAFNAKIHSDFKASADTPVMMIALQNISGAENYNKVKDAKIFSVKVKVNVGKISNITFDTSGAKELMIITDTGVADPSKPFIPFGQNPKKGTGFIIGNKEMFSKAGARFRLYFDWAELPKSIADMDVDTEKEFSKTANLKFLQDGVWRNKELTTTFDISHTNVKQGDVQLFWGRHFANLPHTYLPTKAVELPDNAIVDYKEDYNPFGIASRKGFLKLELNDDFQWDLYFSKLQKFLIALATTDNNDDDKNKEPKKPYLPKLQSMFLSYEAESSIELNRENRTEMFFHLYPFGTHKIRKENFLMPQFIHEKEKDGVKNKIPHAAEFYIGLKNVVPAQKVNVLFKVLDGSTDPRMSKPPEHVTWSYLNDNRWIEFELSQISDTTKGLIETGIISFSIPETATNTNTILPAGCYWLKAGIPELPEQVCRLIDVRAQAMQVTFFDRQNADDFLKTPLAAGIITKLADTDAAVKKVEQPYSAIGGRNKEDGKNYFMRVSERLRHKNRAITIRDIEQLVLEKFPDIHKVKCLNHTRLEMVADKTIYNEISPGHVTVITIPDLKNKNAINPLRPYTSSARLLDIKTFLQEHSNCNMRWHVENPCFEEVKVTADIILTDVAAGNPVFYEHKLKHDLVNFLTPWSHASEKEIRFGGKIFKSSVINFIEELEYVDAILKIELKHDKLNKSEISRDKDEITASTAHSILVSAPAETHIITTRKKPPEKLSDDCK